jgi:hypothetical protein
MLKYIKTEKAVVVNTKTASLSIKDKFIISEPKSLSLYPYAQFAL